MPPRRLWRELLIFVGLNIAAAAIIALVLTSAFGHDSWISRGALRNAAGEWCCGVGDCGVVDRQAVTITRHGYDLHGNATIGDGEGALVERVDEFVPNADALPSPDGLFWRCRDGATHKRRCFFAPPLRPAS